MCYNGLLNRARTLRALKPMLARQAVLLTRSISLRLTQLAPYKKNEQSPSHSPYTLPSSVSSKSFACHSYENCPGEGAFLPIWKTMGGNALFIQVLSFQTLPHSFAPRKTQLFCFQALLHSFLKTPGGGGVPVALMSHDNLLFSRTRPTMGIEFPPARFRHA